MKLLILRNTNSHVLHGKLFKCIQKDIYAPIVQYYFLLIFIFYLARKVEIIWQNAQNINHKFTFSLQNDASLGNHLFLF